MKNILLLSCLLISFSCSAQIRFTYPVTIGVGSSTYITIGGQDYRRGELGFAYAYADSALTLSSTYDSLVTIYWQRDGSVLYRNVLDTMFYYTDSTKQVKNMSVLRTWFRTNAY